MELFIDPFVSKSISIVIFTTETSKRLTTSIYKQLFDVHYQPLCNFANRIVHDMDKSEDIVQDVFVKLWSMKEDIDPTRSVKSLIYTMVKNRCLEVIRRDEINRRAITYLQIVTSEIHEPIDDQEIDKWVLVDQIYVSMRQLPPKCEEVFRLAKVKGLTYTQIATELNISVKTVEGHMSKALHTLRKMLADKWQ